MIYLINHQVKSLVLKIDLTNIKNTSLPGMNVIYFMGPYSTFDKDKNPLLVVHDMKNGLYILNVVKQTKTFVVQKKSERS
jgi:hypothetical protein